MQELPTILHVLSTGCGSCREEFIFWKTLPENKNYRVVALAYRDDLSQIKQWFKSNGNPFAETLLDPYGRVGMEIGVQGTPETFLIDKNGIVIHRHLGAVNADIWQNEFEKHLQELDFS